MEDSDNIHTAGLKSRSLIEQVLQVRRLPPAKNGSSDIFTNAGPLWHPPGAKGIYGGICIAQSLQAAQATVPSYFFVHSLHGQFVLAGRADEHLVYQVSRVSDGKSFATRTVKVVQKKGEKIIFTAIINFTRNDTTSRQQIQIRHAELMPRGIPEPTSEQECRTGWNNVSFGRPELPPYLTNKVGIINTDAQCPHQKRIHHWSKASQKISSSSGSSRGVHTHLAALAYICDNYFIGTVPHVHSIWDFVKPPLTEFEIGRRDPSQHQQETMRHFQVPGSDEDVTVQKRGQSTFDPQDNEDQSRPRVGMMVTLSHTMFFHAPKAVRADEWMLMELASHWAGDGRGVATQKIWSREGTLLASCVQEGVVRLLDERENRVTAAGKGLISRL
ncbi:acyl-CoA thioesterase II [Cladophialophora bantiana CBS 173.52]|uniref:Acyl-CoA thioesterase II n=1 Tax=Cladophialophora bantiana (strain ATCC 10958 / CBS 173.52 / CDC B-1940 / NIH 8579) TaxID=1442370 RepID=A0A0D2I7N2_CLAB1|nr:acyl-CoA thioesterase II [Cladophialophora bantiana CBS 173.52]KIW92834.1 acyl-CoA thioesterase II [Cladophialophora bantiana CBS 173.52]